jgi:mannose-1-phosphate guanylyltransferase
MTLYALIMAGGSGTRMWPRSTPAYPKQFLKLTGELTMLQEAQARLMPLVSAEQVLVATNREYVPIVAQQLPAVPQQNILGEPAGRGTAAAIGLAAIHLRRRDPEAIMAVVTADHLIRNTERFRDVLAAAAEVAKQGQLVTLGIHPTYPETGYGYIQRGSALPSVNNFDMYQVARFAEKPDRTRAEQYVLRGDYAWNSGMFVWSVARILAEIETHMPELYTGLQAIEHVLDLPDAEQSLTSIWSHLPTQTIDYGVMEKATDVAVIPVEIGWSDVGSWAAVYDVLPHDEQENAVVGMHISPDSKRNLIYSPDRVVATIGLEDMIVVDTPEVVLICPRDRAQDVRLLAALLQATRLSPISGKNSPSGRSNAKREL